MATNRHRVRQGAVGLSAGLLLVSCGSGANSGQAGTGGDAEGQLTIGVGTTPPGVSQSLFTSLPERLGYWDEEGIEVEVIGFKGGVEAIQALDAGRIDIGVLGTGAGLSGIQAGTDLVAVYDVLPRSDQYPAVLPDSPIDDATDLCDATIGVSSIESGVIPATEAILSEACGSPDDAEFQPLGVGAAALESLRQGDVDALALSGSLHRDITAATGQELREIPSDVIDGLGFNIGIFTEREFRESHEEVLVGFARSVARATAWAGENLEEAVTMHWAEYPVTKPTNVDESTAIADTLVSLEPRVKVDAAPLDGVWGSATDAAIQAQIDVLEQGGTLEEGAVEIGDFWDPSLLDAINDF